MNEREEAPLHDAKGLTAAGEDTQFTTQVQQPPRRPITFRRVNRGLWKIARSWRWRYMFAEFGRKSDLQRPAFLWGTQSIAIGASVQIWWGARLEVIGRKSSKIVLRIGDGTVIHPYAHIGAAHGVEIGKGVLAASRVYITDHDHDFSNPFDPPVSNGRLSVAPVKIGDFVWLGEGAMVLKGVTIGERSVIGAGSIVTRDVPPYCVAIGSPARVVRRYDLTGREWVRVEA